MGWREAEEGENTCVLMADSCCCMAEANTILKVIILQFKKVSLKFTGEKDV